MAQTEKVTSKLKKAAVGITVFVFWICVWHFAAQIVGRSVILPAPLATAERFIALAQTSAFYRATAGSLLRIMGGYAAGVVCGTLLGMLLYFVKPLRALFSPLLTVIRSTPVASFILLALVMLKNTYIPIFITFLMVLPMISGCVLSSLCTTDRSLLEMAEVYRIPRIRVLKTIYLPSVLPHYRSQVITALGFAWKAGVAAEVLCTPHDSIGKYLYESKVYLETVDLFAYTVLIVIISLLLEKLLSALLKHPKGGAEK